MNSALKPVLPQPGVPQPGGQASPAKGNVATANHTVGLPQGAQNSLHHASNNLVGQNLTHHAPAPPAPHAPPPMAPVSANMAQMAQNMSHHGNLSHVTQNSVGPSNLAASPSKGGNPITPLSLVQEKALALTRTPEKNEPDSTGHANGTIESPKSGSNAPAPLKPQNPEANKDKQDIAKTSPSTPKPPEKPSSAPSTPQKTEAANPSSTVDGPAQPKVATANEPPEKSPSKPSELKPAPAADVAPTQSDSKPVPESANDSQLQEKAPTPVKQDSPPTESAKAESVPEAKPEPEKEKKEEPKVEQKPATSTEEKKEEVAADKPEKTESPKKEEAVEKVVEKVEEKEVKNEEKKPEPKPAKVESKPKSTMKLATVTPPMRKRRQVSPSKSSEGPGPAKKPADGESTPDTRMKRNRTKVQLYQSPTPELAMATKLSASAGRSTPTKPNDDKLIIIYKNEYLAVRNAEGGFYVCQAMQNVYRTTRKIKIRWLSQDKTADPAGETYKPDFYDVTDMECVLTTLSLARGARGCVLLRAAEAARARSILQRALQAEATGERAVQQLTEEHPDGLDLSLYKDESQLEKKGRKRNSSKSSPRAKLDTSNDTDESATPVKRARTTPKRSPKSARKAKAQTTQTNNKRKSAGSTPIVASTSKTATAVSEKAKAKSTPAKRTPAKQKVETPVATPTRKGRRAGKEVKASPIVPTPSTSTGKTTRTPRKPPAKK
ncbi:hypothetical protein PYW08_003046 [Mythimna loreyi]|uniref:Uncharacterized protein n=1 Tax=Mythimna loreyi TaxID=667449 RepID=A0ACC2QS05_9NEOP|nr:hypothetical protein PYW08_003046 [Mythimna loreyi]